MQRIERIEYHEIRGRTNCALYTFVFVSIIYVYPERNICCKISFQIKSACIYFRLYVGKVPEHAVPSVWTDKSGGGRSRTRARFGLLRADQLRPSRREGDEGDRSSRPSASGRFRLQRVSGNVLRTSRAARDRR